MTLDKLAARPKRPMPLRWPVALGLLALALLAATSSGCPAATVAPTPTPTQTATVAAPTATPTVAASPTPRPATPRPATPTTRPTAMPTPTPTRSAQLGTAIEGWMGTIEALPPDGPTVAAFRRDDGARFGIVAQNEAVAQQIQLLCASNRRVRISGELQANAADVEGRRIVVAQLETVGG